MNTSRLAGTSAALLLVSALSAWPLTIKMGSMAPGGSPWDDALREMAAEWGTLSAGAIDLKIYPGGIVGDEDDMLRKMKIGQLDAAGLSGMGLSHVYTGILAAQLPLLVGSDDELNYVFDKMKPRFERELEAKGLKVLIWNVVGWAHFFSKRPVVVPDDLRAQKLFVMAGDDDAIQAWKDAGFHTVPLSITDLIAALQSGMVDAYAMTPMSTVAYQWFGPTKYMCDMKWAPLLGGVVVSTRSWDKVPADLRAKLLASAGKAGATMQARINGADDQAVTVMKQHGIQVTHATAENIAAWKAATEKGFAQIAGKSFDVQSYEEVKQLLQTYRCAHAKQQP